MRLVALHLRGTYLERYCQYEHARCAIKIAVIEKHTDRRVLLYRSPFWRLIDVYISKLAEEEVVMNGGFFMFLAIAWEANFFSEQSRRNAKSREFRVLFVFWFCASLYRRQQTTEEPITQPSSSICDPKPQPCRAFHFCRIAPGAHSLLSDSEWPSRMS
jgi:hypothetical protein